MLTITIFLGIFLALQQIRTEDENVYPNAQLIQPPAAANLFRKFSFLNLIGYNLTQTQQPILNQPLVDEHQQEWNITISKAAKKCPEEKNVSLETICDNLSFRELISQMDFDWSQTLSAITERSKKVTENEKKNQVSASDKLNKLNCILKNITRIHKNIMSMNNSISQYYESKICHWFQDPIFEPFKISDLSMNALKQQEQEEQMEEVEEAQVRLVNSFDLLQLLGDRNTSGEKCTLVLFYAPWCIFSSKLAPHYNALARIFPRLDVVAIDAYNFSLLNSRFGTIAVPNIMFFVNGRAFVRFNGTNRTLEHLKVFITNLTGIEGDNSIHLEARDFIGPLSSQLLVTTDYYHWLSWAFLIIWTLIGIMRSSVGLRVWNTLIAIAKHEGPRHLNID